jgi:hypothetical protein
MVDGVLALQDIGVYDLDILCFGRPPFCNLSQGLVELNCNYFAGLLGEFSISSRIRFKSMRKFWPNRLFGEIPADASNRWICCLVCIIQAPEPLVVLASS